MKYMIYTGIGIGDYAIILPVVKGIKNYDKDAYITLLYPQEEKRIKEKKPLFEMWNLIDDWTFYSKKQLLHSFINVIKSRLKHYDYGLCAQYTNATNTSIYPSLFMKYACKKIIGLDVPANPHIHFDVTVPRDEGKRFWLNLEDVVKKISPEISLCYDDLIDIEKINQIYKDTALPIDEDVSVFVCVGTGALGTKVNGKAYLNHIKEWRIENWVLLANKLAAEDYQVVLLGGEEEKKKMEALDHRLHRNVLNLCGTLRIDQSIAILIKAGLVVGADTGLMHWSGLLGKRSITLFGATDYNRFLTYNSDCIITDIRLNCAPCYGTERAAFCADHKCMNTIAVGTVYARIKSLLECKIDKNKAQALLK